MQTILHQKHYPIRIQRTEEPHGAVVPVHTTATIFYHHLDFLLFKEAKEVAGMLAVICRVFQMLILFNGNRTEKANLVKVHCQTCQAINCRNR